MIEISAINKYEKMNTALIILRYVLITLFGVAASTYLILEYGNILGAVVLAICAISLVLFTLIPSKNMSVRLDDFGLEIDGKFIEWANVLFWVMVDMDEMVECIVQTGGLVGGYEYFYINKNDEAFSNFSVALAEYAPYNPELASANLTHRILKSFHLK